MIKQDDIKKTKTKTVYEWIYKSGNSWLLSPNLLTEEEIKYKLKNYEYIKTGRSWEVPDDNS